MLGLRHAKRVTPLPALPARHILAALSTLFRSLEKALLVSVLALQLRQSPELPAAAGGAGLILNPRPPKAPAGRLGSIFVALFRGQGARLGASDKGAILSEAV